MTDLQTLQFFESQKSDGSNSRKTEYLALGAGAIAIKHTYSIVLGSFPDLKPESGTLEGFFSVVTIEWGDALNASTATAAAILHPELPSLPL